MLSWPKCLLFSTIKEKYLYSQKNFSGTVENRENVKVQLNESFPVDGIAMYYKPPMI